MARVEQFDWPQVEHFEWPSGTLAGHGLAWVPVDTVDEHIAAGHLISVLDDWAATFPGYHLYYAGRRASPALVLVVEALRDRRDG